MALIIIHIARACLMSSQAELFYISFAAGFPIFIGRGLSPECRYPTRVLALSIGMFRCLELVCFSLDIHLLLVCNYKALLLFFTLIKILEKVQKKTKRKPKSRTRKYVIFGSSRVMSLSNRALYITSIGWVIV